MKVVTARFTVDSVNLRAGRGAKDPSKPWQGDNLITTEIGEVELSVVASQDYEEFFDATPYGTMKLGLMNPAATEFFKENLGEVVKIDISVDE